MLYIQNLKLLVALMLIALPVVDIFAANSESYQIGAVSYGGVLSTAPRSENYSLTSFPAEEGETLTEEEEISRENQGSRSTRVVQTVPGEAPYLGTSILKDEVTSNMEQVGEGVTTVLSNSVQVSDEDGSSTPLEVLENEEVVLPTGEEGDEVVQAALVRLVDAPFSVRLSILFVVIGILLIVRGVTPFGKKWFPF